MLDLRERIGQLRSYFYNNYIVNVRCNFSPPFIIGLVLTLSSQGVMANKESVLQTYGANQLFKVPSFKGGYINFGYWKDIHIEGTISEKDRIKASLQLYKVVFDELSQSMEPRKILEIGCGLGNGCVELHKRAPKSEIYGIDITPEQIARAKDIHSKTLKENSKIHFCVGEASHTNFPDASFDEIFVVEAAQYFPSMTAFAKEAYRILKPGGKLVITAHFSTSVIGYEETKKLLPTVRDGIDLMIPIQDVRESFAKTGFKETKFYSIGKNVFEGFDKWISQVDDYPWGRDILKLFYKGFIDYYTIVLKK